MEGGIVLGVHYDYEEPDNAVFSVKDTGLGISVLDQKNLFRMFGKAKE